MADDRLPTPLQGAEATLAAATGGLAGGGSIEDLADPPALAPPGPARAFWAAFRENRGAVMGLAVVAAIVLLALFADLIAPHSPVEQFRDAVKAPPVWEEGGSWRFILGTDVLGRDLVSRLIHGARVSLFIG